MATCNSTVSLILDFLSRRVHESPPFYGTNTFDSRRFIHDYAVREINLLLWFTFFAFNAFLLLELSRLIKLRSHTRRISQHASEYVLFTPPAFRPDLTDKLHRQFGHNPKVFCAQSKDSPSSRMPSDNSFTLL